MQKLFKDALSYVVLNYFSLFLTTVRGILLINILNPFSLGLYKLIFTYSSYFRYYNLGFNALAFYRAPVKGLEESYSFLLRKINITLAWSFGLLFTLIFSAFWWNSLSQMKSLDFILWLFGILYFTQLAETYITICKIRKDFRIVNQYNILFAVLSTILMIALGYFLELRGVIIGLAASTILACLYIISALKMKLPLLFTTVEVWIITYFFGAEETGYYSFVITFVNIILLLNTDGVVFLYSKRSGNFRKDPGFVLKLTIIAFVLIGLVCIAGLFVVDWGIATFFPRYMRASEIYRLCFWGIPFLVARNIVVSYISVNRTIYISVVLFILLTIKSVALLFISNKEEFYQALAASNVFFGVILVLIFLYHRYFEKQSNPSTKITAAGLDD
jgi:O-antigen/teichoic acid export membrane protein